MRRGHQRELASGRPCAWAWDRRRAAPCASRALMVRATSPTLADAPVVIDLQTVGGLRFGDRSRARRPSGQVVGVWFLGIRPPNSPSSWTSARQGRARRPGFRWLPHTAWIGPDSDAAARTVESGRVVLSITFANDVRAQTGPGGLGDPAPGRQPGAHSLTSSWVLMTTCCGTRWGHVVGHRRSRPVVGRALGAGDGRAGTIVCVDRNSRACPVGSSTL